ncbi:DUF2683 family protein [Candidatus Woesearchaeota archaeon]|nr:DUF2683 family protein [Candidatus Woesearchaeota archaeon]
MKQTLIALNEHQDQVLQIIKANQGLKNKVEAVQFIIKEYEENHMEPELRPEFIKKIQKKEKKGKFREYKSLSQLWKDVDA